ncbi:MAG: hypothetical protein JWM95_404 [Gemmatimonadetes bacterium]|nr:hypothetical protein [Gemmatimonadota bacterium]
MTPAESIRTPRLRTAVWAQVRILGIAAHGLPSVVAIVLTALLALLTVKVASVRPIIFHPEQFPSLPGLLGVFLAFGVWWRHEHRGAAFLWTLPVDRRRHALARVFAGWTWLMAGVSVLVLWLLLLTVLSGGTILSPETLRLVPAFSSPVPGMLAPGAWRTIERAPQPLLWLTPFTSASAVYLLASALMLGPRRPLRWIAGTVVALYLIQFAGEAGNVTSLAEWPEHYLVPVITGPYGLDMLLSAQTNLLKVGTVLTTGERAIVWRGVPGTAQWATACLLWIGMGTLAIWVAASRHREDR